MLDNLVPKRPIQPSAIAHASACEAYRYARALRAGYGPERPARPEVEATTSTRHACSQAQRGQCESSSSNLSYFGNSGVTS
eukprot:13879720-Heterocapsa_arctica.AAC.1